MTVTYKTLRKDPKCTEHENPVTITVPIGRSTGIGNVHGEEWYCPLCKGSPKEIIYHL